MAATVDLVCAQLPEVPRAPWGGIGPDRWARVLASSRPVHLHSSFRGRALARDTALVAALVASRRPFVWQFHGTSEALRRAPPAVVLRLLARGTAASVDPTLVEALRARGIDATLVDAAIALDALPEVRAPEPGLVLFLGRLVPEKGVRALLASVRGWPAGARLAVAGDGPLLGEVLAAGPRVTALGWVDAAGRRAWLARAHALVLPSTSEGAPLAVAEAVASGVPVVASGGGAVRSLVGSAGRVLEDPDPGAIARAVGEVLAGPPAVDPAEVARVRARVAPARVADQWRALWTRLAGAR